jgi:hypothetical protein
MHFQQRRCDRLIEALDATGQRAADEEGQQQASADSYNIIGNACDANAQPGRAQQFDRHIAVHPRQAADHKPGQANTITCQTASLLQECCEH